MQVDCLAPGANMGEMGDERADWRVIEEELERRGKNASWLAQGLGYKQIQTVYNLSRQCALDDEQPQPVRKLCFAPHITSAEVAVCAAPRLVCPCLLLGQARCR